MNAISPFAQAVIIITSLAVVITLISAARNKIIFKISFRNSYRRLTTTFLVVLGSMVGTALITGSQVINDSYKNTSEVAIKSSLGEIDVVVETGQSNLFTLTDKEKIIESLTEIEEVDDLAFINRSSVSIQKIKEDNSGLLRGQITMIWADWKELKQFGENPDLNLDLPEPESGSAYISDNIADAIDLEAGDQIRVFINGEIFNFDIERVYSARGTSGYFTVNDGGTLIVNRVDAESIFPQNVNSFNSILLSHKGGLFPTEYDPINFQQDIEEGIEKVGIPSENFTTVERKDSLITQITENGTDTAFAVLSIFGIFAGGLLIVNIYLMLAEERKSEMGILRAIAFKRSDLVKAYAYEGLIYSLLSSLAGTGFGVLVGYVLVSIISNILNQLLSSFGVDAAVLFAVTPTSLLISFSLGTLITYFTVVIASFFVSRVNIVSAIRETEAEIVKQGLFIRIIKYCVAVSMLLQGIATFALAESVQNSLKEAGQDFIVIDGYMWYSGFIIAVVAAGLIFKWVLHNFTPVIKHKRINWMIFTIVSSLIFGYSIYAISADRFKDSIVGNPGYLLIVGVGLVFALTVFLTYNLNIITKLISFLFSPLRGANAVVKTSLKYPAENQTRTGLTLAMYAIIIFIVFFISIYRSSLDLLFTSSTDAILGGYDGLITIQNSEHTEKVSEILNQHDAVSASYLGYSFYATFPSVEIENDPIAQNQFAGQLPATTEYADQVYAGDQTYYRSVKLEIDQTVDGLTKEDVWERLISDNNAVVITGKYSFNTPYFPAWKPGDQIEIKYPNDDKVYTKTIIASLAGGLQADLPTGSILTTKEAIKSDTGLEILPNVNQNILFDFDEESDIGDQSKEIKEELAKLNEFNVVIARELMAIFQAFINQFIYLMQGFLSFGLLVGLAGLAVIMTRSVHERRQQIGMLRSLGFTRRMILMSFILEASMIGLLGIFIGVVTGSIGGIQLINTLTEDFENFKVTYPTSELLTLVTIIYIGTLIFAALPALSAAKLEPVEATNYPE